MSENLARLWRGFAAINTREISDEVGAELLAPDLRLENISTAVTDKTYQGLAGMREWVSDTFDGLDEHTRYEIQEVLIDEGDLVLARVRLTGHGDRSGVPVDLRRVTVIWFRDGKITRTAGYARRAEALEAVGLAE